jgi:hypothetical protein
MMMTRIRDGLGSLVRLYCDLPISDVEGLVMFKRDTQFDVGNYAITVPSSYGSNEKRLLYLIK